MKLTVPGSVEPVRVAVIIITRPPIDVKHLFARRPAIITGRGVGVRQTISFSENLSRIKSFKKVKKKTATFLKGYMFVEKAEIIEILEAE